MVSSTLVILVSVTTVAILSGETFAALPTQCNSGFLEELPPRIRKVCVALARIWREREMNEFVEDGEYVQNTFRENLPRFDSGVKRQDVDHVFLRFGKRR
ncbi:myosuppressin [Pseudomyrmex gracilis]|uniref:myosuppressin n=1 Tax=Pseudomyrmex gracilis TaxID=219809 RepID=UPI000995A909|nr:myosuppressin [Pseudomyrmex gracilis]